MNNSPLHVYRFCPKCGGELKYIENNLLKCQKCSYNFFINPSPCTSVVLMNNERKVLLVQRKFDPFKGTWQTPGGFMHLNESYDESLSREIREELGVEIKIGQFIGTLQENYPYHGVDLPFIALYFRGSIESGTVRALDDCDDIGFFGAEEIEAINITYPSLKKLLLSELAQKE